MHDLFRDILLIFALSAAALYLCHLLRVPTIVGLLAAGVIEGPKGFGIVRDAEAVEAVAELGVILLLFTLGIEFSLKSLMHIRRQFLLGGGFQVGGTFAAAAGLAALAGLPWPQALFLGFVASLSSTAIVLKLLQQRAETESPHGRTVVAVAIFQDLAVVPMVIATPLLAGGADLAPGDAMRGALRAVVAAAALAVLARWIVPRALDRVARTRDSELFLIAVVSLGLFVAWITAGAGLSLALGAFLAGLILSESEYGYRALGSLLPFRDVFMSFFFVSIGMLLDVRFVLEKPLLLLGLAAGVLALKALIAGHAALLLGLPLRTSVMVGAALCQIGEFSFVLAEMGLERGLIGEELFQTVLGVSILTMMASPFAYRLGAWAGDRVERWPIPARWKGGSLAAPRADAPAAMGDHLVIVGFGLNGRNLARVAQAAGIPFVIVEANPDTVREEREKGSAILYGDAAQEAVLERAGIGRARVCAIAISDPLATRRAAAAARRLGPRCHLIVRTRFLREIEPLRALGVDEVIPEEFETSVEIFTRVLHQYLAPEEEIARCVEEIRADGYGMLRSPRPLRKGFGDLAGPLADVEVRAMRVAPGAEAEGRTLGELDLRRRMGVTVVAVRRGGEFSTIPGAEERLAAGDVAILLGTGERMAEAARAFEGAATAPSASTRSPA